MQSPQSAIILFGHGARDPRWADPMRQVQQRLHTQGVVCELAFLELMEPDLATTVSVLAQRGVQHIRLVPMFLGAGGHVRKDLPALVEQASHAHGVTIEVKPALGEAPQVLDAIAQYCSTQ